MTKGGMMTRIIHSRRTYFPFILVVFLELLAFHNAVAGSFLMMQHQYCRGLGPVPYIHRSHFLNLPAIGESDTMALRSTNVGFHRQKQQFLGGKKLLLFGRTGVALKGSFLDDLFGGKKSGGETPSDDENDVTKKVNPKSEDEEDLWDAGALQQEINRRSKQEKESFASDVDDDRTSSSSTTIDANDEEEVDFDGYALRDEILNKWGECFDAEFNKVESYGSRNIYLNILPFRLGSRRFRHQTELDYLCHLQAVVEILVKYDQLAYVLLQLEETKKKPRAGTSPLIAVPLRLDLTPEQVDRIIGDV